MLCCEEKKSIKSILNRKNKTGINETTRSTVNKSANFTVTDQ